MSDLPQFRASIEVDGAEVESETFDSSRPAWEWVLELRAEHEDGASPDRTRRSVDYWRLHSVWVAAQQLGQHGALHVVGRVCAPIPGRPQVAPDDALAWVGEVARL